MRDVSFDFSGRVVVVTGAATGIGRATAVGFGATGAEVALLDVDEEGGREAAAAAGGRFLRCDVTVPEQVDAALAEVEASHGRIDVLVNNAGGFSSQRTVDDLDLAEWQRVLDLNLTSVLLVTRRALPLLRRSRAGRVVNLGSLAGQTSNYRTSPPYAAAKAGVHSLSRVLAFELAAEGITVNAVAPSAVLTERIEALRGPDEREATARSIPLGRYQEPEEVAVWVMFLATEEAGFVTGQTISVNGGRLMV